MSFRHFSFQRLTGHMVKTIQRKRQQSLGLSRLDNQKSLERAMRKIEFWKHWISQRRQQIIVLSIGVLGSNLLYKTQTMAKVVHFLETVRYQYKCWLLPEFQAQDSARAAVVKVKSNQTGWDADTQNRLANLFMVVDIASPQGSTGQVWSQITKRSGQKIYFPSVLSITQFNQILKIKNVDQTFIASMQNECLQSFTAIQNIQQIIQKQADKLKQQQMIKRIQIIQAENKSCLEIFRQVTLKNKEKLQQKLRKTPHNLKIKRKLQQAKSDLANINNY